MAIDLSKMLSVRDKRVRVGRHVCAKEARLVRDWIRHGGSRKPRETNSVLLT